MSDLPHYATLRDYCRAINVSPPRSEDYDVRSFEENMPVVHHSMPPFKHEFYAVAIKVSGGGAAKTGRHSTEGMEAVVFFNSPYQIISWEIDPDWSGFYVILSEAFFRRGNQRRRLTEVHPFLLNDQAYPMAVSAGEAETFHKVFSSIHFEHNLTQPEREEIVWHYVNILLMKTAQLYRNSEYAAQGTTNQRDQDLATVARFRTMIELAFRPDQDHGNASPHQVQFYANQLLLHPNHLNALVKRITDSTASELIQHYVTELAKSRLTATTQSVKEIAFTLYFNYANHFSSFFKKQTGLSPGNFRRQG